MVCVVALCFFFSSRRRHTRCSRDWSSDVCSSDLFFVGIVLIEVVAGRLQWLPAGGTGGLAHYVLPGVTLGWFVLAGLVRLLRSSVLEAPDADYVRTARAKGATQRAGAWRPAPRTPPFPPVTFPGVP